MSDFLFDIDEYKGKDCVYQVRLVKINQSDSLGDILATFINTEYAVIFNKALTIPDGYETILVEYTKGEGITDILGQTDFGLW